ncbi:hypothetical protein G7Y89_g11392 [Cudoniella acicularis]|uniref:Major facilitator superfamily (MFS) profile domain-containing protein n=1 Tax=Cudoniella acicularis TaxID=354080 RepID=A0A8H4RAX3_9HELO|nr:hypothetical protein G7Y89_g11392 [Cudoniella acicularis]
MSHSNSTVTGSELDKSSEIALSKISTNGTNKILRSEPQEQPNVRKEPRATSVDPEKHPEEAAPLHTTFTTRQQIFIVTMTAFASFFSPLSGQIYFPAIPDLAEHYHTSLQGHHRSATSLHSHLHHLFRRQRRSDDAKFLRPIASSCAAFRALEAAGPLRLGYGVISDVCTPPKRCKYLGPVAAGVMLAPAFGSTIGGLLNQYFGWRAIFWFFAIANGVYLVTYIPPMPETARKVVSNGNIAPEDWWVLSPFQIWKARKKSKRGVEQDRNKKVLFVTMGMITVINLLASLSPLFQEVYGFDTLQVGFCYIPAGIAAGLAAYLNADLRNFPIQRVRLQPVMLLLSIGVAAYLPFDWVLQQRVSLAVPLALEFITAFCFVACSNIMSSLAVDLFPESPAIAMAACNLVRCLVAGASAAAVSPMLSGMGWGWCFTFLGLLALLNLLLLWPEWLWGMEWREERRLKTTSTSELKERRASAPPWSWVGGVDNPMIKSKPQILAISATAMQKGPGDLYIFYRALHYAAGGRGGPTIWEGVSNMPNPEEWYKLSKSWDAWQAKLNLLKNLRNTDPDIAALLVKKPVILDLTSEPDTPSKRVSRSFEGPNSVSTHDNLTMLAFAHASHSSSTQNQPPFPRIDLTMEEERQVTTAEPPFPFLEVL